MILALAYQQNAVLIEDGEANFSGSPLREAMQLMNDLIDAGNVNETNDYAAAQQDFLNGDTAILVNGTWVVDSVHR